MHPGIITSAKHQKLQKFFLLFMFIVTLMYTLCFSRWFTETTTVQHRWSYREGILPCQESKSHDVWVGSFTMPSLKNPKLYEKNHVVCYCALLWLWLNYVVYDVRCVCMAYNDVMLVVSCRLLDQSAWKAWFSSHQFVPQKFGLLA
jgi:hypothetical protein